MFRLLVLASILVITPLVAAQNVSIPSGTMISVRTIDKIDSQSAQPGDKFKVSLASPLIVNQNVVANKGADAELQIIEVKKAGMLTGAAKLAITLISVTANGQPISLITEDTTSTSGGKGKSSAVKTGFGAGLGTAMGGIVGGSKGAAIGAGAGAAGGAAVAMVTSGPHVTIPSESQLSFKVK